MLNKNIKSFYLKAVLKCMRSILSPKKFSVVVAENQYGNEV
jgi:isocitrate/isopropylmalate dehydrogenase